MSKIKLMTILGTRPELIRLSEVIKVCDKHLDHLLVHTGQNYDYELNQVFFEDLQLRKPDYFLGIDTSSLTVSQKVKFMKFLGYPNPSAAQENRL